MATYKHLTTIFFSVRCLRKLNQKLEVNIYTRDLKVMIFLLHKGQRLVSDLYKFKVHSYRFIMTDIVPRLTECKMIKVEGNKVDLSIDGLLYLKKYNTMLGKARMDWVFNTAPKRRRDSHWGGKQKKR